MLVYSILFWISLEIFRRGLMIGLVLSDGMHMTEREGLTGKEDIFVFQSFGFTLHHIKYRGFSDENSLYSV